MLNFIRKVDYYGTLIISKDVDIDFVKKIIEELGCSICLISSRSVLETEAFVNGFIPSAILSI